jgi:beta-N-acetylhexosaminidase
VELTEQVAGAIGAELSAAGVNVNLAPVADVNTNPSNPVIGIRSFGADGKLVARHVAAFVRGLQGAGVAACAKHFPGHGATAEDSHHELPVVKSIEDDALVPFRAAIAAEAQAIMTAHIVVRALGEASATMNRTILQGLLREELGYDGLVMTDALEMRAISATVGVEEGAVRAIEAGADALCLGHDLFDGSVQRVCDALVGAVGSGRLEEVRLVEAAGRVRRMSVWASRRPAGAARVTNDVGQVAARRAVQVAGAAVFERPPLVVELEAEPSMAAGPLPRGPADWFREVVSDAEVMRVRNDAVDEVLARANGRPLVVVARDAHRYPWKQEAIEALIARADDVVVVELGLPYWKPPGASAHITTYGAGRVNVEAAAELLSASIASR